MRQKNNKTARDICPIEGNFNFQYLQYMTSRRGAPLFIEAELCETTLQKHVEMRGKVKAE